jgi:3-oxoacyl-[acyl-carrier-protein] synthase III
MSCFSKRINLNAIEMGISMVSMNSYFEFANGQKIAEQPKQVLALAAKSIQGFVDRGLPDNLSHLVIATSCPDMIAPSLGQMLNEQFSHAFSKCHTIDIVQGCAGGVTAMILGDQLCQLNNSSVMVVQADAAKKATSKSKKINKIFGNGSFACLMSHDGSDHGLLHYKSCQYKGLSNVIRISLGHDADQIIMDQTEDMQHDPRKHLGLSLNKAMALRLFKQAETFYLDFIKDAPCPDIMILHQVNPLIIRHLKSVFAKYKTVFVDVASLTGNCGAASVGIALHHVEDTIKHKKVFLCSFGTGGVITAGLWQN